MSSVHELMSHFYYVKDWKSAQKMRAIDHEEEKRKAKLIDDKQKIIHEIEITDREQKFQLQKGDLDPIKLNVRVSVYDSL